MTGWRSREARALAKAIVRAGGSVERTGKGRLRITGPAGTAIVPEPGQGSGTNQRLSGNMRTVIARETGLDLAGGRPWTGTESRS